MKCKSKPFGTTQSGEAVTAYTLSNNNGMVVTVLDYGCVIQSLIVPDRWGKPVDVVLGYDTILEYETSSGYLGALVGRVGNRIGCGEFKIDNQEYHVAVNDRGNHLHGGLKGFNSKVYNAKVCADELILWRISPDGEENYPGNLTYTIRIRINDDNTIHLCYSAISDKDTLFNPTNHSYFNLAGGGSILSHELQLFADNICENDSNCLPTGKLLEVESTPFDFRTPKCIGADIGMKCKQLEAGNGYDHNFCLSDTEEWKLAAKLFCPQNGITMSCKTTMPGVQVYTANSLSQRAGKKGTIMNKRDAICLETQIWPDAIHHSSFPSPVLMAGKMFLSQTSYHFDVV